MKGLVPPAPYANFLRAKLPQLAPEETEHEYVRQGATYMRFHLDNANVTRCAAPGCDSKPWVTQETPRWGFLGHSL